MMAFGSTIRIVATVAFVGAVATAAQGQAAGPPANDRSPHSPSEMAKAIASTINANAARTPDAPIAFAQATSHDNVVEMRFVANDLPAFSRLKGNAEQARLTKATYYCNESRIAYLKQGVVMHEVIATADSQDQIDFTFDTSVCDSLPKPPPADSAKLADLALTVAKAENDSPDEAASSLFRMDGATARQGVVEERHVVTDESTKPRVEASRGMITAISTGYYCGKYRDYILQGLAFHQVFVLPDGSPVIDFTIDRSKC